MEEFTREIYYLKSIGTDNLPHSNRRTLIEHLIGTAKLLKELGRNETEQKAGLFHSIYGTEYYKHSEKLNVKREEVKNLIGEESENLVYIFCNLRDRKNTILKGQLDEPIKTQLRWIEYANLREQNPKNKLLSSFEHVLAKKSNSEGAELNLFSVFPTPIGVINYGEKNRELNRNLVNDIEVEMNTIPSEQRTFSGGKDCCWQSKLGLERKYDSFKNLSEIIKDAIISVLFATKLKREFLNSVKVFDLWANVIMKNGGWSQSHIHSDSNCLWSGVYYPKSDNSENMNLDDIDLNQVIIQEKQVIRSDGVLVLKDPGSIQKQLSFSRQYDNGLFFGGNNYAFPRESLLIMFPATLEHYVTPMTNLTEKRYSISFATGFNKNIKDLSKSY